MKLVPLLALSFSVFVRPTSAQTTNKKVVAPKKTIQVVTKTTGTIAPAFVRILHAVPGGLKFDVYADSLKLASNRGFTGITSYIAVKNEKTILKVFKAGTLSPVIVTDSFNFKRGKHYTVAIYGKKAPALLSINESNGKTNGGKARVRAVHLAPGAPELLITSPSTRNDAGYTKFVSKSLEYGKAGSKLMAPKTTTVQIRTMDDQLIKETMPMSFEAGKRYSAFIIGEIGGAGKNALDVLVKSAAK